MQFPSREDMLAFDDAFEPIRKWWRDQMADIDKKEPSPPQNEKLKQLGHLEEGLRKVIAENGEALKREPSIAGPLQKVSEQATQLYKEKSEGQSGH